MLLAKARELHKECLSMLQYANSAYIGERLKRQKLLALQIQFLVQHKKRDAALKETASLKSEVSSFKDEQRQLALREETLSKSPSAGLGNGGAIGTAGGSSRSSQNKRKLVYVTEHEEKSGGGMLGGLTGSRRGSALVAGEAGGAGDRGDTGNRRARTRMRIREGRSHRWYIDAVNDMPEQNKFLPTFAQYDSFGSYEATGKVGDKELQSTEYSENFLDDIYDNLRSLKISEAGVGFSGEATNSLITDLRRSLSLVLSNNQR
jgi:hypothetical protein